MLALSVIREDHDLVRKGIEAKSDTTDLDKILATDKESRALINTINQLRADKNRVSDEIGKLKSSGSTAETAILQMRATNKQIKELEAQSFLLSEQLNEMLLQIPNIPHSSVPIGHNEADNLVLREWGEKPHFDFSPQAHLELGQKLQLFDFNRGSKISGSGFPLYIDQGARLERALINYMLDFHIRNHGYTEVYPPFMARFEAMQTTGQLPKFAEDMYRTEVDDLYLIPTAEVPLTNIHRDEILNEDDLPINYTAFSACFRREAGSYGKDTRGFLRLHQFNKVELVKFVKPETSYAELETLTKQAEKILQSLGLHYRVVSLCSGDLSFAAAKCYDLEVWAPGEKKWLEVSSCSNFENFQARRGNIRYRRRDDRKVDFVHTLNGSGVATPRLLVALLETFQTNEGKIIVPKPLQAYMGREVIE